MKEVTNTIEVEPLKDTEWIVILCKHEKMDSGWAADSLLFKTLDSAKHFALEQIKHPPQDVRYFKVDLSKG